MDHGSNVFSDSTVEIQAIAMFLEESNLNIWTITRTHARTHVKKE